MSRRVALAVTAGALLALLLVAAATSGDSRIASGPPTISWQIGPSEPADMPAMTTLPEMEPGEPGEREPPGVVTVIVQILFVAGAAVLVVWAGIYAWRNRPQLVWRRRPTSDDFDVLDPDDIAAAVAADAAAQHTALATGTPRNGIVECWLRLEAVVVEAGTPRHPADTSTELTERVLAIHAVDPTAIGSLSSLYREARFSTHTMGEAERRAAITSLEAVHAGLRAGLSADTDSMGHRPADDPRAGALA